MAAVLFISTTAFAQKLTADKVPTPVQQTFKSKFPSADNVKWELEKNGRYEAAFKTNKKEQTSCFNKDGQWVETETEMEASELPQVVSQTISKQFAGYKIKEVVLMESAAKGKLYEAMLVKDKQRMEVEITPTGAVVEKKEIKKGEKAE